MLHIRLWYAGGGVFQPWSFGYTGRATGGQRSLANLYDTSVDYRVNPRLTLTAYFGYAQGRTEGKQQLATRLLDQAKATLLPGTENAADPFFSPDGQWIGFFADGKMKKISVQGGDGCAGVASLYDSRCSTAASPLLFGPFGREGVTAAGA